MEKNPRKNAERLVLVTPWYPAGHPISWSPMLIPMPFVLTSKSCSRNPLVTSCPSQVQIPMHVMNVKMTSAKAKPPEAHREKGKRKYKVATWNPLKVGRWWAYFICSPSLRKEEWLTSKNAGWISGFKSASWRGSPGDSVVKNQPANAGDTGSIPSLGRSHMPWSNQACVPQLRSPRVLETVHCNWRVAPHRRNYRKARTARKNQHNQKINK